MKTTETRYFLYCRKSTDEVDKQILSIESQIAELKEFASKEKIIPVDDYVGGGHVVQHLLFARFFWKFLFDKGLISKSVGDEPFLKLRAPGWILGPDSRKMSKRWGNVITPDDIIPKYGADTLRVYEMFMGPFDQNVAWSTESIIGPRRFIERVWRLQEKVDYATRVGAPEERVKREKFQYVSGIL